MKEFRILYVAILLTALTTISLAENNPPGNAEQKSEIAEVLLSIDPDKVLGRIDEKIYGHFLEHIYHSVNGGLWGEMIWNRSFEELPGGNAGHWSIEGNEIMQSNISENIRLVFGNPQWRDYEYTLEAKKKRGSEGFLIMFRVAEADQFYWYNLGGWNNQRHALEKGVKGARWSVVGPGVEGKIETDSWYRIRVRCEGRRIQIWLDDEQVLDFTDEQGPHLAGAVGLGTWNTAAMYRNIRIKSLQGGTLFEGLPEPMQPTITAKYWDSYGQGDFQLVRDEPLNCELAQKVVSEGDEAGMEQTNLCVRRGQTYRGSLWARGRAPQGMVVRLRDGEAILDETKLTAPSSQWHEYKFQLTPSGSADYAILQVGVLGKGEIFLDQVSLMSESARKTGGFRPDLLQAVSALQPPIIRWPGGCFAEWYRWKDGIGPQHKRIKYPISIWDDQDVSSFGTDEFIDFCRKVGAEPLIVINIGSHDSISERAEYIQEACDWIEYCNGPATSKWGRVRAANGHPEPYNVKYWEIDNETWFMGVRRYCQAVRDFVPPMKKTDPSIKIAVCGSGGFGLDWSRRVIEAVAELTDYLSIHHYENPNKFAEGPVNYERFIQQTGKLIAESVNPKVKIYCSEWNAQSTDWRTGLYAGGLLNGFERCSNVFEIGGPALFLRHATATAWDNAFINFDHRKWFPAPNYVVMKLWRLHYAPNRIAVAGQTGSLNVVGTKSADGQMLYLKCVNPEDKAVKATLKITSGFSPGSASLQLVAPDSLNARNTLDKPRAIQAEPANVQVSGRTISFTMPRWSAAVVRIVSL